MIKSKQIIHVVLTIFCGILAILNGYFVYTDISVMAIIASGLNAIAFVLGLMWIFHR